MAKGFCLAKMYMWKTTSHLTLKGKLFLAKKKCICDEDLPVFTLLNTSTGN